MKMNWKKYFVVAASICLGSQIFGALISILFSMPAQVVFWGAILDPADATPSLVAKEFLSKGTALAPPLLLTLLYILFFVFSLRKGILGIIGTVLLVVMGILFTFATRGEYTNPTRFPHMPALIFLVILIINNIFTMLISILGVLTFISKIPFNRKSISSTSENDNY
ncbi:hypothetical protein OH784_07435 [Ectobacillus funiculus]|uniref:hypothetical protein n=1 Tax=Ectobacillus funiculus TaxID=137993 RepID=UPI00397D94E5